MFSTEMRLKEIIFKKKFKKKKNVKAREKKEEVHVLEVCGGFLC